MERRKYEKALKRIRYLPAGADLLRYGGNKARHLFYKGICSTRVARPSTLMLELTNQCNLDPFLYNVEWIPGTLLCQTFSRGVEFRESVRIGAFALPEQQVVPYIQGTLVQERNPGFWQELSYG